MKFGDENEEISDVDLDEREECWALVMLLTLLSACLVSYNIRSHFLCSLREAYSKWQHEIENYSLLVMSCLTPNRS